MRKLPKPRSSTLFPVLRASVMLSKTVLTMSSVSFFVRLASLATSSISSALVIPDSPARGNHAFTRTQPRAATGQHPTARSHATAR